MVISKLFPLVYTDRTDQAGMSESIIIWVTKGNQRVLLSGNSHIKVTQTEGGIKCEDTQL